MPRTLKVAIVGLGPVGQSVARAVLQTPSLKIVAATDPAPLHSGRDLGTVLSLPRKLKVKVEGDPSMRTGPTSVTGLSLRCCPARRRTASPGGSAPRGR